MSTISPPQEEVCAVLAIHCCSLLLFQLLQVLFDLMTPTGGASGYLLMTLNRPKALNALNMNMINLITPRLKVYRTMQIAT